ncbi:glutathione S-transferase N-terminal domain-containing protein [Gammaproteobacteria bacterium]|nr:glutathione S-transferase N-terminal domain-containing protein [Gammaproteobacteria bacterium]
MELPILYSFKRCPYAMRARMAIFLTDTICEIREVKLSHKPLSMLEVSNKGTVPVLIDKNGKVYDESLDIINWALQKNNIFNENITSEQVSYSHELIAEFDKDFKFHLDRYKYSSRYISDEKLFHRDACMTILNKLELSYSKDVWFFDNKINMIDICILPFIRQFRIADTNWFDALEEIPEIQGWLNRFLESKLLKNIMINYNTWEPENKKEFFPYKPIES